MESKAATIGGTLLIVFLNIKTGQLFQTAVLAAVGATVSFTVSLFLKYIIRLFKNKQ
jgi:hypothetical protein